MAYEVALDETLKVDSPDLVEGALLQRLEEHQADLDAFLQELNAARKSETSNRLALQQLLKTAAQLQAKLGLSSEISGAVAAALEKVGIPVQPLQEAKALLLALSRLDAAMDAKEAAPSKLKKVLDSWEELRRMEDVCKEEEFQAAFGKTDLDLGRKREQLQSMCEHLLMEVRADEAETFQESLQKIGLEVERRALAGETRAQSASPTKRSDAVRPTSPARCRAAEAAVARSRSPTPPPGMSNMSETSPRRGKAKEQMFEAEVTFSGTGLNSFIESQKQALLKEREAEKVVEEEPNAPSLVTFGKGLPTGSAATGQAPACVARAAPAVPPGSPELWRAVHVGDEHVVARLIQQGLCNGLQKDASGHSVLWHAIAFGHWGLARMMLERFPPASQDGVDVNEVHHRKGETFLHLLCQCRPFSSETATIFKALAEAMPHALFTKVNMAGQSFLAFAAATQNFWVLRHISLRYPEQMKVLICSKEAPLRFLMQKLPAPVPPSFSAAERIPEHVAVSALLSPDASGRVPFADVAFDVSTTGIDSFSRFLAHRVVVASQSSVLLARLPWKLLGRPVSFKWIDASPRKFGGTCCSFSTPALCIAPSPKIPRRWSSCFAPVPSTNCPNRSWTWLRRRSSSSCPRRRPAWHWRSSR